MGEEEGEEELEGTEVVECRLADEAEEEDDDEGVEVGAAEEEPVVEVFGLHQRRSPSHNPLLSLPAVADGGKSVWE